MDNDRPPRRGQGQEPDARPAHPQHRERGRRGGLGEVQGCRRQSRSRAIQRRRGVALLDSDLRRSRRQLLPTHEPDVTDFLFVAPFAGRCQRSRNWTALGANLSWNWKMPPWPESGKMISSEPGMRRCRSAERTEGAIRSLSPLAIKVGAVIFDGSAGAERPHFVIALSCVWSAFTVIGASRSMVRSLSQLTNARAAGLPGGTARTRQDTRGDAIATVRDREPRLQIRAPDQVSLFELRTRNGPRMAYIRQPMTGAAPTCRPHPTLYWGDIRER